MNIVLHHRAGSFSERWIKYLQSKNIPFKKVDIRNENLENLLSEADIILCHLSQEDPYYWMVGNKLGFLAEVMGKKVYPDLWSNWFFDDKIIQKYLLDNISDVHVPTHISFNYKEALSKVNTCSYPFVFKLKGGAGSVNVKLIKSKFSARILVFRMFFLGIPKISKYHLLLNRLSKAKNLKNKIFELIVGTASLLKKPKLNRIFGREKGYFYMQEFIEGANHDIRIIVIGNQKLIALKRYTRKNDFKASGSGNFQALNYKSVDVKILNSSLQISKKLKAQSLALDFVYDRNNKFHLIEISHGFIPDAYDICTGYWDQNLKWHDGNLNLAEEILINILKE
ncbi:MAG: hypothetical protein HWD84_08235 [Flavobacteriaceae bacterium]|nr:hypothetical protein [Flavobacteriaceae bacterium]